MRFSLLALLPLAIVILLPSHTNLVEGHGMLVGITIAGKPYTGPPAGESGNPPPPSVIRQIRNNGPVEGSGGAVNSKFMSCGNDAKPAALEADAMPGDVIELKWSPSVSCLFSLFVLCVCRC